MTEIGAVIDGKYEILKEIGRGGMSTVYLAMDKRLNKQWAVKEIRKKGSGKNDEVVVNSLLAEANLMKRLDHPALPRIVDIIDNGVTIYVIMDYIEGESLDKILSEYGAQPEEQVIEWAKQLCDALSYLHSQRPPIIYRDMKPANVMLKPEGNIKIIDFGIAREYKEQNLADTTVLGTKGYAPPEQYSGQTDPRSDIFALGMTMHHLLTGIDPRNGETYAPVRQWNPELSEGIEAIIDKCVQPAAENRYQNCTQLLQDLQDPGKVTKGWRRKQKRKLVSFIASAGLCVLMVVSGFTCNALAAYINTNNYEAYIASQNNIGNYKLAIEIYPDDPRAYNRILDTFDNDINARSDNPSEKLLTAEEFRQLEPLYDPADSSKYSADYAGFAEVNYRIGKMCFTYYERTLSQNENFSARINKAYNYLSQNHDFIANSEETHVTESTGNMMLSECYFQICDFYKKYIFSQTEDASSDDFKAFFESLYNPDDGDDELLDKIEKSTSATAYDKLELYNNIFMLLYDRRADMVSANVDRETVLQLFDYVYGAAETIDTTKDIQKILKGEMQGSYGDYRAAIERAYTNAEGRS